MIKLEKIAIQTTTVTCCKSTCKAVFTASIEEFIPQGGRYGNDDHKYHPDYVVECPHCKTNNLVTDPKFDIRYVTPSQLNKEKRMALATKIRKATVSLFKEIGHLFYRVMGID